MLLWWYKCIFKSYFHLFREADSSHDVVTRLGNSVRFQAENTFPSLHQKAQTRCSSHPMKCVLVWRPNSV